MNDGTRGFPTDSTPSLHCRAESFADTIRMSPGMTGVGTQEMGAAILKALDATTDYYTMPGA